MLTIHQQKINGLILCGGESSRMGTPKALLKYGAEEQYLLVYKLLKPFCNEVYISCKAEQANWFNSDLPQYNDLPEYEHIGPIAALLTAIHHKPGEAFLVLGCDYPALQKQDIEVLVQTYFTFQKSCCYINDENKTEEPLLAVYHPSDLRQLPSYYELGHESLRVFLNKTDHIKIVSENPEHLKSYDTPEAFRSWVNGRK